MSNINTESELYNRDVLMNRPCLNYINKEIDCWREMVVSIPDASSHSEDDLRLIFENIMYSTPDDYCEGFEDIKGALQAAPKAIHPLKKVVNTNKPIEDKFVLIIHVVSNDYFEFNEDMQNQFKAENLYVPIMVKPKSNALFQYYKIV